MGACLIREEPLTPEEKVLWDNLEDGCEYLAEVTFILKKEPNSNGLEHGIQVYDKDNAMLKNLRKR